MLFLIARCVCVCVCECRSHSHFARRHARTHTHTQRQGIRLIQRQIVKNIGRQILHKFALIRYPLTRSIQQYYQHQLCSSLEEAKGRAYGRLDKCLRTFSAQSERRRNVRRQLFSLVNDSGRSTHLRPEDVRSSYDHP